WTGILLNGYLRFYVATIVSFLSVMLVYRILEGERNVVMIQNLTEVTVYEAVVVVIMFIATLITVFSRSRLLAVVSMGVIGYALCLIFVFYSAPDLAMTQ